MLWKLDIGYMKYSGSHYIEIMEVISFQKCLSIVLIMIMLETINICINELYLHL